MPAPAPDPKMVAAKKGSRTPSLSSPTPEGVSPVRTGTSKGLNVPRPERTAESHAEDGQHRRKRAARAIEHHAKPQVADANSGRRRRFGRGLPFAADFGEKARP